MTTSLTAAGIRKALDQASPSTVPEWRVLRRGWSRQLRDRSAPEIIQLAERLLDSGAWGRLTAYELVAYHPGGVAELGTATVRRLARGLDDWVGVDTFGCCLAGPAWREGHLPTGQVEQWLRSSDRWQRRLAVVCTVPLNLRARGGRGDVPRTLAVCRRVVDDRDDMVVKALSWALRSAAVWDRQAIADFLETHAARLAPRVLREVRTKLRTGRKTARPGRG